MSYQPLHHKYRPQTFANLVGQEAIASTLINAIEREKIAPAYLFTGPRGTGKTSSARILAKSLNCLATSKPTANPCGKCEACRAIASGTALDVIEIDAASNTGVDNIREIIERSRFAPVQCRYKVYVIDECHMLSTAAFNALLKTLEEPPPSVVFVLATTDPQRVLSTIISRCQRFDYRRIRLGEMTAHLKYIATEEKIDISNEALALIGQIANGGLRDAESLLDQLSLLPAKITVEKVWDLVGAVPERDLLELLQAIKSGHHTGILQQCRSLLDRGREPLIVLQNLANFYLNLLIAKTAPDRPDLVAITETGWQELCQEAAKWQLPLILQGQQKLKEAETQLKQTTQARLWLEVTLLGLLPTANVTSSAESHKLPNVNSVTGSAPAAEIKFEPTITEKLDKPPRVPDLQPEKISTIPATQTAPEPVPRAQNKENEPPEPAIAAVATPQPIEPSPITPPSETAVVNSAKNQEIWQRVIESVGSRMTQTLLSQQCHLISLQGSTAIVGISNAKLRALHQGKVTNIETAFAKVCQRKIKVQLEVSNANDAQGHVITSSAKTPSIPSPTPRKLSSPPEHPTHNPVLEDTEVEPKIGDRQIISLAQNKNTVLNEDRVATISNQDHQKLQSHNNPTPQQLEKKTINSSSPMPLAELAEKTKLQTDLVENSARDYDSDDLQQAIEDLTQSFEGEVIQLDTKMQESLQFSHSPETEVINPSPTPQIKLGNRPDFDDYDDDF